MMDMNEFVAYVKEEIEKRLPGYEVITQKVIKNNDLHLTGLTVFPKEGNKDFAPTMYVDFYFEAYTCGEVSLDEMIDEMVRDIIVHTQNAPKELTNMGELFQDYAWVKSHLAVALVNRETNEDLLKSVLYKPYLDLAIIYMVHIVNVGTVKIKKEHLALWDVSEEELHHDAMENAKIMLPAKTKSVLDNPFSMGMTEADLRDNAFPLYMITNEMGLYGASVALYSDALAELAEKLDSDLYIIPSSVHELLALPADENYTDLEFLKYVINDANNTDLSPDEVLSNHAYVYDRKSKEIIAA